MKKKKGFTLVELLAVIVILAVILVIAVPKIMDTIQNSKEGTLMSSAKLIAGQAEKKYVENQVLGITDEIECSDIVKTSDADYDSCDISFDSDGKANVTIAGKGKFEGMAICGGTKTEASISDACYTDETCFIYQDSVGAFDIDEEKCIDYFEDDLGDDVTSYCEGGIGGYGSTSNTIRDDINAGILTVSELEKKGIISNVVQGVSIKKYDNTCTKNVWIPDKINNKPVVSIENSAFINIDSNGIISGMGIKSVKFPNTIVDLGRSTFLSNDISGTLDLSNLVKLRTIGSGVFNNNKITSLILPESIVEIENAFSFNQIESIDFGNESSIKKLGFEAFWGNSIYGELNLGNLTELQIIDRDAFTENEITSVTLPSSVTYVGERAFSNSGYDEYTDESYNLLTNVTLGNSNAEIECESFGNPSEIETHNLPSSYVNNWKCEEKAPC